MSKRGRDGNLLQPDAVNSLNEELERNLTFFLGHVGPICERYSEQLKAALPNNPKARRFFEDVGAVPQSPLLQRAASPAAAPPVAPPPRLDREVIQEEIRRQQSAVLATASREASPSCVAPVSVAAQPQQSSQNLLYAQLRILKAEARSMLKCYQKISDWLALSLLELEDLDEESDPAANTMQVLLSNVEESCEALRTVYCQEKKYLEQRWEIEVKMLHHPNCLGAPLSLQTLDSATWDTIEKSWRAMIRSSLLIHALFSKNLKQVNELRKCGRRRPDML